MKPTNAALNALLASSEFIQVDAYIFYLVDGTILTYTSGDRDIVYGGARYSAGGEESGAIFNGGQNTSLNWKVGLEVDTLTFDVAPRNATVEGYDWFTAIRVGLFDGAQFALGRFYLPPTNYDDTSAGLLIVFNGKVGEIGINRTKVTFNINGFTELLNQPMPRNVYQANCLNTLYDSACTINQASFVVNGTISSGSTGSILHCSLGQATDYFSQGKMKFTSGVNNNLWRTVQQYTNGSPSLININVPLYTAPSNGDTFIIYPGCDKTMSTCTNKFNNLANFRGFPFIPENSTAI